MFKVVLKERSKKEVDRAVEEIMRKVKNEKERHLRCYHIASQYYKIGDFDSARRYVCMYLSTKEDSPMAHKLLGQALEGLGQKEKAVSEYKRSLELENNQPDLVLKICQLISENEVHFDVERARYWCERGQDMFPHDPAIFRLKERLLSNQNGNGGVRNTKAFEDLINSELKALPYDVNVRIRLLKLYIDTGRTQMAYNHVIEVESKQSFRFDLSWYEYLSELFQIYYSEFTSHAKSDCEFFINWVSALERLVALTLAETSMCAPKTMADCSSALLRFDLTLHQAHLIPSPTSKLYEEFLKHMSAQFCFEFGTYIFKKAKKEQNNWKEATKSVQPLLLLSLVSPPDLDAPYTVSLKDNHKKLLNLWNENGSYRVCQAGNILLSLAKECGQQLIEKIIHSCNINWRERLYQKIFGKWDSKDAESKSHFVQHTGYNNLPHLMVPASQLRSTDYIKACENIYPGSLHHIVWLGLQTMRHSSPRPPQFLPPPAFHTYGFSELQYTVHNLGSVGIETLNRLDLDSFLYATVLCAGAQLDDQIRNGFYAVDRPMTLPADITVQLCTPEQAKWWNSAYKIYKKQAGNNWGDLRMVLSRGIEVIRAVGNHGLDVLLMVQLARTFTERAISCSNAGKGSPGFAEVSALESRANLYWRAAIPLLERIERKQAVRAPPANRLFEYRGRGLEPSDVTALLEEGRLFTAVQLMKDEEHEQAIEAFKSLRSPYASFHSAGIYKRLAQTELSSCPGEELTSEMRSKHVILLTKAREALRLTKERIQDDWHHPLHQIIGSHMSDVESLLSRIELDGAPVDDRSEGVALSEASYSPPGSLISRGESAAGDFNLGPAIHHELNGRHAGHYPGNVISSTPKNRHTLRNHISPHQKPGLTSGEVEKMLVTHEGAILNKIESLLENKIETLLENHRRKIINEVTSKLDIVIDEFRRDMNKLRPEDLYMLADDDDYTEDVLGFPASYQPPPQTPTVVTPAHAIATAAPFYGTPAPVIRGAQGTSTVTYGAPPQTQPPPQFFTAPFQPSPQPPIQPHQLGFYSQGALPFSEGQQLPDFLRAGQSLSKQPNVVITTSDTLPTGPPPIQPTLSVTIPPKHRMGTSHHPRQQPTTTTNVPHEFQISMPPSAHIIDLQKSPVAMAAEQDDLESDEGAPEVEHDPFPDFKPIIPLPDEIVVTTGEEGEKVLFENRAKLFRFTDKEWKERGVGMLKILQDNSTGKVRFLMRREQVHKICANHYLTPDMKLTPMVDSDRAWVWLANDFAEEKLQIEKLCAKFKTSDDAAKFKEVFDSSKVLSGDPTMQLNQVPPNESQRPPSSIADKLSPAQHDQLQSTNKIEVGGFTFTSRPVFKTPQAEGKDKESKESKVSTTTAVAAAISASATTPSPFASFSFSLPENNTIQKPTFLIPSSTLSSFVIPPAVEPGSSIFQSSVFSTPNTISSFQKKESPSVISSNSSVLKPPVFTPPASLSAAIIPPAFAATAPLAGVMNTVQSQPSVFPPAPQQQIISQTPINRDILKTPIFSTPTGPNLILNQLSNKNTNQASVDVFPTSVSNLTTTTGQAKHVLFKDATTEGSQKLAPISKPNSAQNVSPKSILKETLASEPLSSSSNPAAKSKHVLFQESTKGQGEPIPAVEGTSKEKITLRRPHLPLQKLLASDQDSLFDKPSLVDFSTLAKSSDESIFKKTESFQGFEGAGTAVFRSASVNKRGAEEVGDENDEFIPSAEFTPVVPLPELITVETGEEGEISLYEQRAKLLRFDNETKQWKERGVGKMKILHDPKNDSVRLLMRREQVFKVCCNHRITPEIKLTLAFNSDKAWTWYAQDYSDGVASNEFFALRFKTTDQAMDFKDAVEKAKEITKQSVNLNLSGLSNISSEEFNNTSCSSHVTSQTDSSFTSGHSSEAPDDSDDDCNVWKCDFCLFPNADVDLECRACRNSKCDNTPLSQLNMFKRPKDVWECPLCFVMNGLSSTECMACGSQKSTVIKEITSTSPTPAITAPSTTATQPSLSELFKPKAGSWECSGCLVRNFPDVKQCPACKTMKDGETAPTSATGISSQPASGLTFGSNSVFSFSNTGFNFGMPQKNTEGSSGATFSFGISPGSNNKSGQTIKDDSVDSVPKPAAKTGFTFGMPSMSGNENKTDGLAAAFTKPIFGSAATNTFQGTTPSATFTFGAQSTQVPSGFVFKGPEAEEINETDKKIEFNFSGVRRPRTLSGSSASGSISVHPDSGPESEGEVHEEDEEGDGIFFQPVIPLPDKVPVTTGEENEEVLYSHRAKLFRFIDGEWKERGIGDVKILKHEENKKIRLLMRRETVLKICLNHFLTADLSFQPKDDKTWLWCAMDYSEGEISQEKFAIRFKTSDIASNFKDAIDTAQTELSCGSSNQLDNTNEAVSSTTTTDDCTADIKDSPAMRNFKFTLPSTPTTPTSPSSGFSLSAQFGNSDDNGTAKSLFGGSSAKPSETSTTSNVEEGEVEVLYEKNVSEDLREKALRLKLPPNFYSYINAPSCPGCEGCEPEDRMCSNNAATSTINTMSKAPHLITSPSVSSNSISISSPKLSEQNASGGAENQRQSETDVSLTNESKNSNSQDSSSDPAVTATSQKPDEKVSFLFKEAASFSDLAAGQETGFKKAATGNFQWSGANTQIFGSFVKTPDSSSKKGHDKGGASSGEEDDGGEGAQNANDPQFEPIIPLPPLVALSTGEEEEERLFCDRSKLFVYHTSTKEWKERGVGEMKILYHSQKLTYRLLMRREQVHKIVCNHLISPELNLTPLASSNQAWCWVAMNMTEEYTEPKLEKLAIKFKNIDIAKTFKEKVDECIVQIRKIKEAQTQKSITVIETQKKTCSNDDEEEVNDDDDDDNDEEVGSEENSDDNSDDDVEDEDNIWETMYEKEVTVSVRDNEKDPWLTLGTGLLSMITNIDNTMLGQIKIVSKNEGAVISCTSIDRDCEIEVKNETAVWTAKDTAIDPPSIRQIKATFDSETNAHVFDISFQEVLNYTRYDAV